LAISVFQGLRTGHGINVAATFEHFFRLVSLSEFTNSFQSRRSFGTDTFESYIGLIRHLDHQYDDLTRIQMLDARVELVHASMNRLSVSVVHMERDKIGGAPFKDVWDGEFSAPFAVEEFVAPLCEYTEITGVFLPFLPTSIPFSSSDRFSHILQSYLIVSLTNQVLFDRISQKFETPQVIGRHTIRY
jgi:hypothetical protein